MTSRYADPAAGQNFLLHIEGSQVRHTPTACAGLADPREVRPAISVPTGSPARRMPRSGRPLSRSASSRRPRIKRISRPRHPTVRSRRVTRTAPRSCPSGPSPRQVASEIGSEMGAAIRRQLRSDAVRRRDRGRLNRSYLQQRHQAAVLFACALSSHRGGQGFKSPQLHPKPAGQRFDVCPYRLALVRFARFWERWCPIWEPIVNPPHVEWSPELHVSCVVFQRRLEQATRQRYGGLIRSCYG